MPYGRGYGGYGGGGGGGYGRGGGGFRGVGRLRRAQPDAGGGSFDGVNIASIPTAGVRTNPTGGGFARAMPAADFNPVPQPYERTTITRGAPMTRAPSTAITPTMPTQPGLRVSAAGRPREMTTAPATDFTPGAQMYGAGPTSFTPAPTGIIGGPAPLPPNYTPGPPPGTKTGTMGPGLTRGPAPMSGGGPGPTSFTPTTPTQPAQRAPVGPPLPQQAPIAPELDRRRRIRGGRGGGTEYTRRY